MSEFTYSSVTVSGSDAFDFLQAQLATDLTGIANSIDTSGNTGRTAHRSAWCNPKGRVICTPTIETITNGFALSIPADLGAVVLQRLMMFRFRAKVDLDLVPGKTATADDELRKLQAGIPEIAQAQTEKFTPHMLNLDLLQMVSLEKGCYPGQEIVARTHYRGASKRRCLRFACDADVQPGDKVADEQRDIGEVVNALAGELLAVVPLTAAESTLYVGGQPLSRLALPYKL
jgi:folate-binding protein YgfZ